jgi:hypothetical protein
LFGEYGHGVSLKKNEIGGFQSWSKSIFSKLYSKYRNSASAVWVLRSVRFFAAAKRRRMRTIDGDTEKRNVEVGFGYTVKKRERL